MVSLQQASFSSFLNEKTQTSGSSQLLCFHRRANTALILNKIVSSGDRDKGELVLTSWNPESPNAIGTYLIGSNINAENQILQALPLESFDAFLLLVIYCKFLKHYFILILLPNTDYCCIDIR